MKGLVKKNILSLGIKVRYILLLLALLVFITVAVPIEGFVPMIAYSIFVFLPVIVIVNILDQTNYDDYKSEIILPVRRRDIVAAKYIVYFIVFLFCILIVSIFLFVNYKMDRIQMLMSERNLVAVGVGMTLLFGGIFFPAIFLFNQKNIKTISAASFILTIVPIRLFMEIMRVVWKMESVYDLYKRNEVIWVYLVVCFLFFVASCFFSIEIVKKKEF